MKTCSGCKLTKNENEFHWHDKDAGRRDPRCKVCRQKYWQQRYKKNVQKLNADSRERHAAKYAWLRQYKSALSCKECDEHHPACLDFHYRDKNKKDMAIATAVRRNWSIERLQTEIAKCDVLCSNCHRKLHWNELNDPVV